MDSGFRVGEFHGEKGGIYLLALPLGAEVREFVFANKSTSITLTDSCMSCSRLYRC